MIGEETLGRLTRIHGKGAQGQSRPVMPTCPLTQGDNPVIGPISQPVPLIARGDSPSDRSLIDQFFPASAATCEGCYLPLTKEQLTTAEAKHGC